MKVTLKHYTPLWIASEAIRTCWASQGKSDWGFVTRCNSCGNVDAWYRALSDEEQEKTHDINKPFYYNVGDNNISVCNSCGSADTKYSKEIGVNDRKLIERVGNKFKHSSTLEHITYNFSITGISRAVLQELARHRIASLSVKSSRYTLKELKNETSFYSKNPNDVNFASDEWERAEKYIFVTGNVYVDTASLDALENLRQLISDGVSNDVAKYCMPEAYKTELAWSINMRSLQNFLHLRTNKAALQEIRNLAHAVFLILPEDHKFMLAESISEETITVKMEKDVLFDPDGTISFLVVNPKSDPGFNQSLKMVDIVSLSGTKFVKTSDGYDLTAKMSDLMSIGYIPTGEEK